MRLGLKVMASKACVLYHHLVPYMLLPPSACRSSASEKGTGWRDRVASLPLRRLNQYRFGDPQGQHLGSKEADGVLPLMWGYCIPSMLTLQQQGSLSCISR